MLLTAMLLPAPASGQSAGGAPPSQADVTGIAVPPPGVTQELLLRDGTRAVGRVERIDGSRIFFTTTAGAVLEVEASQIVTLREVEGSLVNGEFMPADSNPSRLFFGPTARSLPGGSGYVAVYEFVLPFVQVGITDRISVGVGTPLVFGGDTAHPFWLTPKVQVFASKTTQAALGVMHFANVDDGSFGVAYGVLTKGTRDAAVTFGLGYGYERSASDDGGSAVLAMIGGERRVSRRLKVITENYVFKGGGLVSGGVRFLGEHLSADLGLVVPIGVDEAIAFPMVNFVWRFGKD
jgi:hypothetical protein